MAKQRHTPIRTCVACRETDEKRDLLRVVRPPDGIARFDPKGKLSGRGAYVCARPACIALARKQKKLERSLKIGSVPPDVFDELNAQAALNPTEDLTKQVFPSAISLPAPASEPPASESLASESLEEALKEPTEARLTAAETPSAAHAIGADAAG